MKAGDQGQAFRNRSFNAADRQGKVNAEAADIIREKPAFEYLESDHSAQAFRNVTVGGLSVLESPTPDKNGFTSSRVSWTGYSDIPAISPLYGMNIEGQL